MFIVIFLDSGSIQSDYVLLRQLRVTAAHGNLWDNACKYDKINNIPPIDNVQHGFETTIFYSASLLSISVRPRRLTITQ